MKTWIITGLMTLSLTSTLIAGAASAATSDVVAKKGKSEPAPKDKDERKGGEETPDSREETYEGNDRGGGSFDGGGYDGDSGGGMGGEVFYVKGSGKKLGANVKVEDRGNVLVYTETTQEDLDASETCTTITRTVVDKASGKVLSQDSSEFCNRWPL